MDLLRRLIRDESAEDLIEYGLLAAFVALIATAAVIGDPLKLKKTLVDVYNTVSKTVSRV